MPCADGGYDYVNTRDYKELMNAFCSACTQLEKNKIPIPLAAQTLWNEHKKEDQQRKQREKVEKEKELVRQKALQKLSPKEKDVLGLR